MNNKNTEVKTAQKTTDKVFELTWYDKQGYIDKNKVLGVIFFSSITIYLVALHLFMAIYSYIKYNFIFENTEKLLEFETTLVKWYINNITNLTEAKLDFIIVNISVISLILVAATLFILYVKGKANLQASLSSISLNQFFVEKINKKTNTYRFKLIKGEQLNFDSFKDKSGNLKQIFGYEHSIAKREGRDRIIVQFSNAFPSVDDLQGLSVKDFQEQGKILLGIGLPDIGVKINKKDLIKNRYVAKYIEFEDLPQGIGNFGGAGFGKSNTLNMIFQSIFINFDKVKSFTFIDFKQGIEAEPYRLLEKEKKTNRIYTLDDDRYKLLNYLEKLLIITKARALYIKDNGLKNVKNKAIITFFDEMAEVLDCEPKQKQEKLIQNRIYELIESLLRIGRAAGIIIGYSTQSPLQHTSGLSSGMKNNTPLRMTHGLTSSSQVSSVYEDLQELGYNPVEYDIGRLAVINTTNSTIFEARALFVPDDFTKDIEFEQIKEDSFDTEIKEYYKRYIELEKKRLETMNIDQEDKLFTLDELLQDLLEDKLVNDNLYDSNTNNEQAKKEEIAPIAINSVKIDFKAKAKAKIHKAKQATDEEVESFINLTDNITPEDINKLDEKLNNEDIDKYADKALTELEEYSIEDTSVSNEELQEVQKIYDELDLDIDVIQKPIKEKKIEIDFI